MASMEQGLGYSGLTEISTLIRRRQLSPLEIVELCLERIERLNPKLNAFITILADQAREQASAADTEIKAGRWRGPLHGIPVAIKDFYDTAGIKTTAAVEHFRNRIPANDAKGVAKLKKAGAILLGKTNMDSLGMGTTGLESYFGHVNNPWNVDYIAGGSSSGSAAALASGMCYATTQPWIRMPLAPVVCPQLAVVLLVSKVPMVLSTQKGFSREKSPRKR